MTNQKLKIHFLPFKFNMLEAKILLISSNSFNKSLISFLSPLFVSRNNASQTFDSLADFKQI